MAGANPFLRGRLPAGPGGARGRTRRAAAVAPSAVAAPPATHSARPRRALPRVPRRLVPAPRRLRARCHPRRRLGGRAGHASRAGWTASRSAAGSWSPPRAWASSRRSSPTRASCSRSMPTATRSTAPGTACSPTGSAPTCTSQTRSRRAPSRAVTRQALPVTPTRSSPRSSWAGCAARASTWPPRPCGSALRRGGRLALIDLRPDPAGGPPPGVAWTWHDPALLEAALARAGFGGLVLGGRAGSSSAYRRRPPERWGGRTPRWYPPARCPPSTNRTIATVGSGVMAEAMIAGLLARQARRARAGRRQPSARRAPRRPRGDVRDPGRAPPTSRRSTGADVIILAVKPQMLAKVGREIGPHLRTGPARAVGARRVRRRRRSPPPSATTRSSGRCPTRRPGSATA